MQGFVEWLQAYPDLSQFIGVIGFMLYIGGFFSIQSGVLCGNGIAFPALQVCAACCVLVSLSSAYNLPSFMIQTSYIAIGIFGIALRLSRRKNGVRRLTDGRGQPGMSGVSVPGDGPVDGCHEPATLFRHTPKKSDSPKSPALCP